MSAFMDHNFLLPSDTSRILYHDVAKNLPILDFHSHVGAAEIANNIRLKSINELFLSSESIRRCLLASGVSSELLDGQDDFARFFALVKVLRGAVGSPLFTRTYLMIQRVFELSLPFDEEHARKIYDAANARLLTLESGAQALLNRFRVEVLCTENAPEDELTYHRSIVQEAGLETRVLPSFCPDQLLEVDEPSFLPALRRLEAAAQLPIKDIYDLETALARRVEFFSACGARASDHRLFSLPLAEPDEEKANHALKAALKGEKIKRGQAACYLITLLTALGEMYHRHGFIQQYHIDAEGRSDFVGALTRLLSIQDKRGRLPKTILYPLSKAGVPLVLPLLSRFHEAGVRLKVQLGISRGTSISRDSLESTLRALAGEGLLASSIGMPTDSHSLIGCTEQEYFRRVLCRLIGSFVESGEYPNDIEYLKKMVRNICYDNAKAYFEF